MIDAAWKDWFRAKHDQRCLASGDKFEEYVTSILGRLHTDFLNPEPMGKSGDGGCDGLAEGGSILYACYGQRAKTDMDRKTSDKLESDFARGIKCWDTFTTWRFVTNAPLGPKVTQSIITLQQQHDSSAKRPVHIEIWNPDDLWWKAANNLSFDQLDQVIPGAPHAQNVELDDLVELIISLESVDGDPSDQIKTIRPVPATKMDFNQLPEITRAEFKEGRQLSPRIDKWFSGQPDPELRDKKARSFKKVYEQARQTTTDVREIVWRIYEAVGGQGFGSSTTRANAVYAVTVYFFDSCDIFEEPPAADLGDENHHVASV